MEPEGSLLIQYIDNAVELKNLKVAAAFIGWTFSKIVSEVEDIIDVDKQVKHSVI